MLRLITRMAVMRPMVPLMRFRPIIAFRPFSTEGISQLQPRSVGTHSLVIIDISAPAGGARPPRPPRAPRVVGGPKVRTRLIDPLLID